MKTDREEAIELIDEARRAGASQSKACEMMDISAKTYQRWTEPGNDEDGRITAWHPPANQLTQLERQRMIKLANEPA